MGGMTDKYEMFVGKHYQRWERCHLLNLGVDGRIIFLNYIGVEGVD
jgi:hypothetical protein